MNENKNQIVESSVNWFIEKRHLFKKLCFKIESILVEVLEEEKLSFHAITSRVKDVESFRNKISNEKYDNPIEQITDLSGIRIITYVEDDVKKISKIVENIFEIDNEKSIDKSKNLGTDKVGYKSVHYIGKLKKDRLKLVEYKSLEGLVFEIQIRSILQHAWAEIEHDRNYKFSGKLPDEIARRFMLLSGSLEIADREFNNISKEIDELSNKVIEGTQSGELNFEINSTSLEAYIRKKFSPLYKENKILPVDTNKVITELKSFGINTIDELDKLSSETIINKILNYNFTEKTTIIGILRTIMMLTDAEKYFEKAWQKNWINISEQTYHLLLSENIPIDKYLEENSIKKKKR
ncbi:hypothetical protein QWZ06_10685 [Chryseobacterium tructae]|uniref:GTP pyrophosphokinase family protein n=1 Tax=Chryseobacterium tructae TaxID=1037380 RepID=A0ABV7XWJ4_9FLAO|nr:hypothetical protein [Chryseobacterium tructae]MDN3692712.1 hypothetical protein [Chryseobacterium tructae]